MIENQLKDLLRVGNLNEALDRLIFAVGRKDEDIHNELIILSGRLNANQRLHSLGMLEYEKLLRENAAITQAILNYIDQAESDGLLAATDFSEMGQQQQDESLRILFIATNPVGTLRLELEKEFLAIRKIFANKRSQFEVIELFNTTIDSLFEKVRTEQPDILHISGPATSNYLILHRENDEIRSVPFHFLSAAFRMFKPYVKCVFINTMCSKVFLKKVSIPLEAAIGSEYLIDDNDAIIFSTGWYTALSQGESYRDAFHFGLQLLKEQKGPHKGLGKERDLFTMFVNGVNLNPDDQTPPEYEIEEPAEVREAIEYSRKRLADHDSPPLRAK